MRQALRIANPDLNTRAMRRGALQTMANNNVPPDTLMTFSGHTNIETVLCTTLVVLWFVDENTNE